MSEFLSNLNKVIKGEKLVEKAQRKNLTTAKEMQDFLDYTFKPRSKYGSRTICSYDLERKKTQKIVEEIDKAADISGQALIHLVSIRPDIIQYYPQTEAVCLEAIRRNLSVFEFVENKTDTLVAYVIEKGIDVDLLDKKYLTKDVYKKLVGKNIQNITSVPKSIMNEDFIVDICTDPAYDIDINTIPDEYLDTTVCHQIIIENPMKYESISNEELQSQQMFNVYAEYVLENEGTCIYYEYNSRFIDSDLLNELIIKDKVNVQYTDIEPFTSDWITEEAAYQLILKDYYWNNHDLDRAVLEKKPVVIKALKKVLSHYINTKNEDSYYRDNNFISKYGEYVEEKDVEKLLKINPADARFLRNESIKEEHAIAFLKKKTSEHSDEGYTYKRNDTKIEIEQVFHVVKKFMNNDKVKNLLLDVSVFFIKYLDDDKKAIDYLINREVSKEKMKSFQYLPSKYITAENAKRLYDKIGNDAFKCFTDKQLLKIQKETNKSVSKESKVK